MFFIACLFYVLIDSIQIYENCKRDYQNAKIDWVFFYAIFYKNDDFFRDFYYFFEFLLFKDALFS